MTDLHGDATSEKHSLIWLIRVAACGHLTHLTVPRRRPHLIRASLYGVVRFLIGEDAAVIERELGHLVPHEHAGDMRAAVQSAFRAASTGDIVLLAPACASFDMFDSFEHRGKIFKEEVQQLIV